MIPMWIKMKFPRKEGKPLTLYLPIFLVWILLLTLFILILPIWLFVTLMAYVLGFGWTGLVLIALIANTLWHLQGLEVDVESKKEMIYMKFI